MTVRLVSRSPSSAEIRACSSAILVSLAWTASRVISRPLRIPCVRKSCLSSRSTKFFSTSELRQTSRSMFMASAARAEGSAALSRASSCESGLAGVVEGENKPIEDERWDVAGVANTSSLNGHSSRLLDFASISPCVRFPGEERAVVRATLRGVSKRVRSERSSCSALRRPSSSLEHHPKLSSWLVVGVAFVGFESRGRTAVDLRLVSGVGGTAAEMRLDFLGVCG